MRTTAKIIAIGNSRGIRLPKQIIDELELGDAVELETRGREVIIRPARDLHEGWEASAIEMHGRGGDHLLIGELSASSWDESDWTW
jgi:antitoxin MazE